jgi:hypothetical protein
MDVNDKERVSELVSDFHSPRRTRFQSAVDVAEDFPGCYCRFGPRGMFVRELPPIRVELVTAIEEGKKIAWHRTTKIGFRLNQPAAQRPVREDFDRIPDQPGFEIGSFLNQRSGSLRIIGRFGEMEKGCYLTRDVLMPCHRVSPGLVTRSG